MQALHYSISPEIPIQELVRELSSVWGAPNGSLSRPLNVSHHSTAWNYNGVTVRLEFRLDYGPHGRPDAPVGIVLYAKRDALPAVACSECTSSYLFPPFREKLTLLMQKVAQIAAEDPALTRQIVSQSGPIEGARSAEDPSLAIIRLGRWLEVAKRRSPQQRAAALLLADFYVENAQLGYATKPYVKPAEFYKRLGAEYDKEGTYVHNFLDKAENMDDGGDVSELAALWALSAVPIRRSVPGPMWPLKKLKAFSRVFARTNGHPTSTMRSPGLIARSWSGAIQEVTRRAKITP